MAFVRKNFERQSGGKQKIFSYNAGADTLATVKGAGYITDADLANGVDVGDIVMCVSNNNTMIDNLIITSARGVSPLTLASTEADAAT